MRTRLQMGAEEAESSRHHLIRDMTDLAWWIGAESPSIETSGPPSGLATDSS